MCDIFGERASLSDFGSMAGHYRLPFFSLFVLTLTLYLSQITGFMNFLKMASKTKLNVQSFPRPPLLEQTPRHLQIKWNGELIADTKEAYWVLETHHPPSNYLQCLSSSHGTLSLTRSSLLSPTLFDQSVTHQNAPQDLVRMERRSHVLGADQPQQPFRKSG